MLVDDFSLVNSVVAPKPNICGYPWCKSMLTFYFKTILCLCFIPGQDVSLPPKEWPSWAAELLIQHQKSSGQQTAPPGQQ